MSRTTNNRRKKANRRWRKQWAVFKPWGKPELVPFVGIDFWENSFNMSMMDYWSPLYTPLKPVEIIERIVTPEQLAEGYLERVNGVVYHREYKVLSKLPDGNTVVLNPPNG